MGPIVLCKLDNFNINDGLNIMNNYPFANLDGFDDNLLNLISIKTGKKVKKFSTIIDDKIKDRSFFDNKKISNILNCINEKNSLHLVGTLKKGSFNYLVSLIEMCRREKVYNVYIHLFLKKENFKYLDKLNLVIKKAGFGIVSTIMDESYIENDLNTFELYDTLVSCKGNYYNEYDQLLKETDKIIKPSILDMEGIIKEKDSIIVFDFNKYLNEFCSILCDSNCEYYIPNVVFNTFLFNKSNSLFELDKFDFNIFSYLSDKGLRQLKIEEEIDEIKKCKSISNLGYDFTKTTDVLLNEMNEKKYDFVFVNYKEDAIDKIDESISRIHDYVKINSGLLLIMSCYHDKVTFIVSSNDFLIKEGNVCDVAPTILDILGIKKPDDMEGFTLILKNEVSDNNHEVIKKSKKNKHNIFVIISITVFLILMFIYTFRFFYYRSHEDKLYTVVIRGDV